MLDKLKELRETAKTHLQAARPADAGSAVQHLVGLDIGTEYIKALIGRVAEGEVEIIGVGRAHQGLSDMQAGAVADIGAVVENCDKALNEAEQQAGVSARGAVIGIAGELVKGTTTTVRVARKQPNKA